MLLQWRPPHSFSMFLVTIVVVAKVAIGAPSCTDFVTFVNGGFEDRKAGFQISVLNESLVPGWSSEKHKIELWTDKSGVPPNGGNQFTQVATVKKIWQDFQTAPGHDIAVYFAHRGYVGNDTVRLGLGPPNLRPNAIYRHVAGKEWVFSGAYDYRVPPRQYKTRLTIANLHVASGLTGVGNLIDDVVVWSVTCGQYFTNLLVNANFARPKLNRTSVTTAFPVERVPGWKASSDAIEFERVVDKRTPRRQAVVVGDDEVECVEKRIFQEVDATLLDGSHVFTFSLVYRGGSKHEGGVRNLTVSVVSLKTSKRLRKELLPPSADFVERTFHTNPWFGIKLEFSSCGRYLVDYVSLARLPASPTDKQWSTPRE